MNPAYFVARFRVDAPVEDWPSQFVILSAWATTGESWTQEENEAADRKLAGVLSACGLWRRRIIGYSPVTGHSEPSWAFPMSLDDACDLGQQFQQDALYNVQADQLSVTRCNHPRGLVPIGPFRERIEVKTQKGT